MSAKTTSIKDRAVALAYVQSMVDSAEALGARKEVLLKKAKIPLGEAGDFSKFVSVEQYETLLKVILEETGNPAIGLHMGKGIQFGHHGTFAFSALSFPNAWQAMYVGKKFSKLVNSIVDFRLEEGEKFNTVRIETIYLSGQSYQMLIELVMAMFCEVFSFVLEGHAEDIEIDFTFGEPAYTNEYAKIFKQKIQFAAQNNEIRIPKKLAEKPFAMANPIIAQRFEKECDALLANLVENKSIVDEVREVLLLSKKKFPNLDETAAQLNISSRTLRRHLQENDSSYKKILDQIRFELAERYLNTTQLSIAQIAFKLGYEDQNSFSYAFKELTGLPPSEFRKSHRENFKITK